MIKVKSIYLNRGVCHRRSGGRRRFRRNENDIDKKSGNTHGIYVEMDLTGTAEGPTKDVGQRTVSDFTDANEVIQNWARTAPEEGEGYNKVDLNVMWEDGEVYKGRYDMTRKDVHSANIGDHIKGFVEFYAGLYRPPHLTAEQYEKYLKTMERRSGIDRKSYMDFIKGRQLR